LLTYLTSLHAAEKVRVVLNRSTRSDEISDADIERLLRMSLYCKLPNEYLACIKAINSGTLLEAANTKQLNKALTALAADIAGLPGIDNRKGLFGMLLKPSMGGTNA
jgi:Flp pilus assembly CpaE family ATPase